MVDFGATNSFIHSEIVWYLNATNVDVLAVRVTLANGSYIDYSIAVPLNLKLYGNLQ